MSKIRIDTNVTGRVYKIGHIYYFDKTPKDIVCPHFYILNWAFSCPYDCAYCYLQGTFRGKTHNSTYIIDYTHPDIFVPYNTIKIYKPYDEFFILQDLETFIDTVKTPSILNAGELSESLMYPDIMMNICELFTNQNRHKLLILSKSSNVKFLLENDYNNIIPSFSINSMYAWKRWEHKTPSPIKRLDAAMLLSKVGYPVRLRYDPIIPHNNWMLEYNNIVEETYRRFNPTRVTLGTIRGLKKTILYTRDRSWTQWFDRKHVSGWGYKLSLKKRLTIYSHMYKQIREHDGTVPIGLCKEEKVLWKTLRWNYNDCKCNCAL